MDRLDLSDMNEDEATPADFGQDRNPWREIATIC
jgi:hypothetical protein